MIYDGIILGSGHNALILQAYCGLAGLRTLTIERRDTPGGGLATLEDPRHPGFLHNTHSFFHRGITAMPWYRDLKLAELGAKYIEPELNVAMILRDGRSLQWWTDFEKTVASFESIDKADADSLQRWRDAFVPIVDRILVPESRRPPLPPEQRAAELARSTEGRLLLETSKLSPLEFVTREFRSPIVRAGLLFFNGLREVDLREPGFGHHIPALLASRVKAQMCVGGAANLGRALVAASRKAGGEILLQTQPAEIVVEHGRAVGVRLQDGSVVRASKFVASGLNPQQTFLDLLDPVNVPAEWRDRAAGFKYNLLAPLFALNLNLREPPRYAAAEHDPALNKAFMVILGLDHADQFHDIVRHHEAGTIPPTVMWGCAPTTFDPSQAPPGGHTAFMWEKLPYRLHGDPQTWDRQRDAHGKEMLDLWTKFAPNLGSAVIDHFTRSPLDVERTYPNMREGDLLVGAFSNGQVGYHRPFPGAGHYRAHIPGLYLCGSSSFPGGNVTGLPGYNAAQVLLADLGLPWTHAKPG